MAGNDNNFKKMMEDELKRAVAKVTLDELKGNLENMAMASEAIALIMKTYYDGFIKAGFDPMQAMYLTSNMGSTMLGVSMIQGKDGDGK